MSKRLSVIITTLLLLGVSADAQQGSWKLIGRHPDLTTYIPATSPSGTRISANSSAIIDSIGATWTFGTGTTPMIQVLRNGSQAASAFGAQILWYQNHLYVQGEDLRWYLWDGAAFGFFSDSDPEGVPCAPLANCPIVVNGYGFGMSTRAAYGAGTNPTIYRVTSLSNSGANTLREALEASGPRVVVFETSGTIVLSSDIYVTNPYLTIAGQTAPSPGITLRGYGIWIYAHDVLMQHFRIRPGDTGAADSGQGIRAGVYEDGAYNIVLDHMSVSWANDEGTIVAKTGGGPGNSGTTDANVTFWRCLIAEGLNFTSREPLSEGKGLAVNYNSKKVAAIQNVYVSVANRLPLVKGGTQVYFSNNIVYNWSYNPPATFVDPTEDGTQTGPYFVSLIGNLYRTGPSWDSSGAYMAGSRYAQTGSQLYLSDNSRDAIGGTLNEFIVVGGDGIDPRVGSPALAAPAGYTPMAASSVLGAVLGKAGARPQDRDDVDTRLALAVTNRTGSSTLSSQTSVGGWPTLAVNTRALTTPDNPNTMTASGYTNLEIWLHTYAAGVE